MTTLNIFLGIVSGPQIIIIVVVILNIVLKISISKILIYPKFLKSLNFYEKQLKLKNVIESTPGVQKYLLNMKSKI